MGNCEQSDDLCSWKTGYPSVFLNRFRQMDNATGTGARLVLISLSKRAGAQTIACAANYIELSASPHFQKTFVQAIQLG